MLVHRVNEMKRPRIKAARSCKLTVGVRGEQGQRKKEEEEDNGARETLGNHTDFGCFHSILHVPSLFWIVHALKGDDGVRHVVDGVTPDLDLRFGFRAQGLVAAGL
jgi:hypothetical protein